MKNIQLFKFAHVLVLSLSTCVSSGCGQTCCLCSAFIWTRHCLKHLLMSGHSLRNCNFNDLYFSSELRANNETHNSSGTSVPAPFYPLLCKCIWPLLEAAVKRALNLEPTKLTVSQIWHSIVVWPWASQVHSLSSSSLVLWASLGQGLFYFFFVELENTGTEDGIKTRLVRSLNFLMCKLG